MEPIHRGLISSCCRGVLWRRRALRRTGSLTKPRQAPRPLLPANGPSLTGKERMGRKWMDEQRIDNCNVPIDKRGNKPRPANCLHSPSG